MQRGNLFLAVGLLSIIFLTSCIEETTLQCDTKDTKGILHVHPQWAEYDMRHAFDAHLYQEEAELLYLKTPPMEYTISAESGAYSIINHNTDASGIQFTDLDNYHKAKATAVRIDQSKAGTKELYPSENAFRLAVDSVAITAGEETHLYPLVHSLIKTLVLKFEVRNTDKYQRINGALKGVYYAVYLATGLPVGEETDWKIPFQIDINEDYTATAIIHLLGIYNPDNGDNYENSLHVELEDDEGDTYPTDVDLSDVITDMLEENKGDIPIDIPVEIEVELEVINGSLVVNVKPWEEGKGGGKV